MRKEVDNLKENIFSVYDHILDQKEARKTIISYSQAEKEDRLDIRGTKKYNQELSQRRAQSVVNYLLSKGLSSDRVKARGFGIDKLIHTGTDISEKEHQENRRSTLEFKVYGTNARAILVEALAPSWEKPKNFKIKVEQRDNTQCRKSKDKHQKEITIKEFSNQHTHKVSTQKGDTASYPVYSIIRKSFIPNYLTYLLQYLNPAAEITNSFYFYIHSCAYYSSKNQPAVHLKTYPDVVWIVHGHYNFKEKGDYFFHNKKVELKNGIEDVVNELMSTLNYIHLIK